MERDGDEILISFYDWFAVGETYVFSREDAIRIRNALTQMIGPPV